MSIPAKARMPEEDAPAPLRPVPPASAALEYPVAGPGRRRARHWAVILSFAIFVVLPACLWGWYLWTRAADQYASHVAFSVRAEETGFCD